MQILPISYDTWKQVDDANPWPIYHVEANQGASYHVLTGHTDIVFLSFAHGADKTEFDTNRLSGSTSQATKEDAMALLVGLSTKAVPKNSSGSPRTQVDPREGSKLEMFSQNFCDKRTWFSSSTRTEDEAMTDSGDGLTWNLSTPGYIVDVEHGRIEEEHKLHAIHKVIVKVDGTVMTQHSADSTFSYNANLTENHNFASGDGDYGVDFTTGDVTFKVSQAGKSVTISYSRVVDSKWILIPDAGKHISLMSAELQFSEDARLKSDFIFQGYAKVDLHPQLQVVWDDASNPAKTVMSTTYTWDGTLTVTSSDTSEVSVGDWISLDGSGAYFYVASITTNVSVTIEDRNNLGTIPSGSTPTAKAPMALYPTGTILPLGPPTRYRTKANLIIEANYSYPTIPKDAQKTGGGWGWRDLPHDVQIYRWDYVAQAYIDVRDEWGMYIEISLENDVPSEGSLALVTFYGLSEDE